MKAPDLQPVKPRVRSLFELARREALRNHADGLLFLNCQVRTPSRIRRWLLRED